ncbi:MAG: arginine--tRNA ligase [Pirellulales bacterium]|nr:arginine--tRNA ligase [Pirellulales bacterium]
MNLLAAIREQFARALVLLGVEPGELSNYTSLVLTSQDAKFGDYQANCAMPLGKRLGKPPREVAAQLVAALELGAICERPEIAGPGFINLRVKDDWLASQVAGFLSDPERQGVPQTASPRTYVIDYSSPNVAKPMHVGHIRSTVIGDALCRILKFAGHQVISDNHLGDWGTQFGMILYGLKHFADAKALNNQTLEELTRLYKLVNSLVEYHDTRKEKLPALEARLAEAERTAARLSAVSPPSDAKEAKQAAKKVRQQEAAVVELRSELAELRAKVAAVEADATLGKLAAEHAGIGQQVLQETARLHSGDATNIELWRKYLPACLTEMEAMYARLGVRFDHTLGESYYQDRLRGVVKDLCEKKLARESDGAICVFLEGHDVPMIVQKQDGAFLYGTTDLATIQYRMNHWRPDAILYVVDHRQSLHFEQLFAVARLWGYGGVELQHIAFGTVLGDDGKPFKTRSGASVGLASLLDEAVERAYAIVSQNDDARPEAMLSEVERRQVAERIGIGAIKYADLAHNRTSDYVFSYDKMLAMTGNTAAYMQYSYARVKSIFTKVIADSGLPVADTRPDATILLGTPQERALALALVQFAEALDRVTTDYRPNHLTAYLFDLATHYSTFFEHCPVLRAETEALRASRLALCNLTARTLRQGLELLGIEVVERM